MKLPKSFRPDKDLDEKTNQLYQEAKIVKHERLFKDPHLDEILYSLNNKDVGALDFHSLVEDAIPKYNYAKLEYPRLKLDYWKRQDTVNTWNGNNFLIRTKTYEKQNSYVYAKVYDTNVNSFVGDFENSIIKQDSHWQSNSTKGFIWTMLPTVSLALGLGFTYIAAKYKMISGIELLSAFSFGIIAGVSPICIFIEKIKHSHKKYINYRIRKHTGRVEYNSYELIRDTDVALTAAFDQE
ncbi:MAG: hypothetical protein KKA79_05060 [Nanoarchaeota archaeon]|nr:hypothetical protein [Nanoarchaeota archaeon]MCG2718880.1 hypothetical protein [Nanoarchaeota archaeon]